MFKPFFEEEADDLDNRGTVILHELAHVIGLNSEKELNDINSAESLRNFILLVTKKVSKEALLESIKNAPPKLKLSTSVLAYSPDQPRDPKGTPTGGQWSSDDNNSSNQNGKSEDDSKTSKSDKETQSEESKEEKNESKPNDKKDNSKDSKSDRDTKESFIDVMKKEIKDIGFKGLELLAQAYVYSRGYENPKEFDNNPDFVNAIKNFVDSKGGNFEFDEKSQWTKDLKNSKHFTNEKNKIILRLGNNEDLNNKSIDVSLSYSKEGTAMSLKQMFLDIRNILSTGKLGTASSLTTGSIVGKCTVEKQNDESRTAILNFKLNDALSLSSLTRNPNTRKSLLNDNPTLKNGETVLKNVNLSWTWSEKISY